MINGTVHLEITVEKYAYNARDGRVQGVRDHVTWRTNQRAVSSKHKITNMVQTVSTQGLKCFPVVNKRIEPGLSIKRGNIGRVQI